MGNSIDVHDLTALSNTKLLPFLNAVAFSSEVVPSLWEWCVRFSAFAELCGSGTAATIGSSSSSSSSGVAPAIPADVMALLGSAEEKRAQHHHQRVRASFEAVIVVMALSFSHMLHILDDEELVEQERVLRLDDLRVLVRNLKVRRRAQRHHAFSPPKERNACAIHTQNTQHTSKNKHTQNNCTRTHTVHAHAHAITKTNTNTNTNPHRS